MRPCNVKQVLIFGLSALLFSGTTAAFSVELAVGQDDNLNNAPDDAEQVDSLTYTLRAQQMWSPWQASRAGLDTGLSAQWHQLDEVSELSWLGLSAQASAWTSLGSGLLAPSLTLISQLGWRDYRSRARDGEFIQADLILGQRLTTQITAQLQAGWQQRNARYAYYEGDQLTYGAAVQWSPTRQLRAFVQHDWRQGDLTVSIAPDDGRFDGSGLSYGMDDAFDGFKSYRVDSDGQITSLGVSWQPSMALGLSLRATRISNDAAKYPAAPGAGSAYVYAGAYQRTQTALSVFYRF